MCTFDDQFMYVKDNIVLYPDCKIVFYKEINPYTLPFKVSFNWHQLKKNNNVFEKISYTYQGCIKINK